MTLRVTFLSPRLPPATCGVGDHTWQLAQRLAVRGMETAFVYRHPPQPDERLPGPAEPWSGDVAGLAATVAAQRADWLWVQLSGYGYSRWGAPYRLSRAMGAVRRDCPSTRIAVCAHEGHCPPGDLGVKGCVLSPWQRHTVGAVARLAELALATIPPMRDTLIDVYGVPADRVRMLPIGANIPAAALADDERQQQRRRLGWGPEETVAVAFGTWAKQWAVVSALAEPLAAAARRGTIHRVVCLGGSGPAAPAALGELRLPPPLDRPLEIFGRRADAEIAAILACCDLGLCFTPRPMIGKSGAFLAMAGQGLPVVIRGEGDPGFGLAGLPGCLSPHQLAAEPIPRSRLAAWGRQLQAVVQTQFDWEAIADRAAGWLASGPRRFA